METGQDQRFAVTYLDHRRTVIIHWQLEITGLRSANRAVKPVSALWVRWSLMGFDSGLHEVVHRLFHLQNVLLAFTFRSTHR